MKAIYLDTETTGLRADTSHVVEVAICDDAGAVLLNTLLDPGAPIPPEATAIHGISDEMVAGMPKMAEVLPLVLALARGRSVVIYNAAYDTQFLPGLRAIAGSIDCCMLKAQWAMGQRRWPKLSAAAEWSEYVWTGNAHRALADTLACRHVWQHIARAAQGVAS